MDDWRLRGQEDYLQEAVLHRAVFPEFWENAYAEKNEFYQKIRRYALHYVETTHKWEAFLEGDQVGRFWHDHCEFCWEKAYTHEPGEFYCTENYGYWICGECFRDLREKFCWTVEEDKEK